MNKFGKALCFLFLMTSLICLYGCYGHESVFSGSKTGNDNQFLVDFDILNTTVCSTMPLAKGDSVEVTVDITKGAIDIAVENEQKAVIYHNSDMLQGKFTIDIAETDTYTINLTGYQAQGSVHFNKR